MFSSLIDKNNKSLSFITKKRIRRLYLLQACAMNQEVFYTKEALVISKLSRRWNQQRLQKISGGITYPAGESSVEPWLSPMQIPLDDTAASSIKRDENRSITVQEIWNWNSRKTIMDLLCYYENLYREICIQGPSHAMLAANNEPKSCPSVAPAPIKPNNLEPDWIERNRNFKRKAKNC